MSPSYQSLMRPCLRRLVPDEIFLRLYDREHQMRLTDEEGQAQRAKIADERAEAADERAENEAERAKAAAERAEVADERTETAIRKAEALAEKLRSLGINPDEI